MRICQSSEKYVTYITEGENKNTVLGEEITNSLAQMREENPILSN